MLLSHFIVAEYSKRKVINNRPVVSETARETAAIRGIKNQSELPHNFSPVARAPY